MSRVLPPIPFVPCALGQLLTLHTLTSISAEESQTSHRIYTCFVNEPTADSYFVLYLFRIPLVKKKKKKLTAIPYLSGSVITALHTACY